MSTLNHPNYGHLVEKQEVAAWIAAGLVVVAGLAPAFLPRSGWTMMLGSVGLIVFLCTHGTLTYGWRGVLGFFACAYSVAFAFQALSIATGFPFGYFTHHSPGAHLPGVPPASPSSTPPQATWPGRWPGCRHPVVIDRGSSTRANREEGQAFSRCPADA